MIGHTPDQVAALASLQGSTRGKYGAKATVIDGIRFDSQKEARRYGELKLLERAGQIFDLRVQGKWPLCACTATFDPEFVGWYICDFAYYASKDCAPESLVIEDVKGGNATKTALYRWKRRHMKAQYGITILET